MKLTTIIYHFEDSQCLPKLLKLHRSFTNSKYHLFLLFLINHITDHFMAIWNQRSIILYFVLSVWMYSLTRLVTTAALNTKDTDWKWDT